MSNHISPPPHASLELRQSLRELHQAVGCLCEVRKPDNQLVFLGRVQDFDGRAVMVVPTSAREAPPVIFKDEFKLVFRIHERPPLVWHCEISGSTRWFWKLDCLNPYHREELRSNFRQPVNARAKVLCINPLYPGKALREEETYAKLCKVLDVSLGGLQLQGQNFFHAGDYLLIMDLFLDPSDRRPFAFTVHVRWKQELGPLDSRYGCAFQPMSVQEEDRLCAAIFSLQRQDISSH